MAEKADYIGQILALGRAMRGAHMNRWQQAPHAPWLKPDLTMAQLRTLWVVSQGRASTGRELAAELGVTPGNITGIVDRLVEQGLLARRRNPRDRRVIILRLTPKGVRLMGEMEGRMAGMQQRIMSGLPRVLEAMSLEDLAALARGIAAFTAALELVERQRAEEVLPDGGRMGGERSDKLENGEVAGTDNECHE